MKLSWIQKLIFKLIKSNNHLCELSKETKFVYKGKVYYISTILEDEGNLFDEIIIKAKALDEIK